MKMKHNEEDKTYSFNDNGKTEIDIGQTIKSNIDFWKEKYFELEKNSIPISLIEKRKEEIETMYDGLSKNPKEHLHSKTEYKIVIGVLQELLDERNNTDE